MQGICMSLLRQYRASNNNKAPQSIIFYVRSLSFPPLLLSSPLFRLSESC
jgi:hypothetical protein